MLNILQTNQMYGKILRIFPMTPPPPDVRIRTSHSGKMNFEREFSVHDFYFSL